MTLRVTACGCIVKPGSYCPIHQQHQIRADQQRRQQRRQRDGRNTKAWARHSKAIIAAAGGRCQLGLPGCTGLATTTHLDGGGFHSLENISYRAACRQCHGRVDGGVRG